MASIYAVFEKKAHKSVGFAKYCKKIVILWQYNVLLSLLVTLHCNTTLYHSLIVHGLTSPPTQYRLYGRRFLQVKRPNQQYQSTEGTQSTLITEKRNNRTQIQKNTANPLVYNNTMG